MTDKGVQGAATKIQAAFKGHQARKAMKVKQDDDLPDLEDKDVQDAATKIQAAFKGHKVRQGKMASEVKKATVFKGQMAKQMPDDDLPDLEDKDVQDAVTKIQAAFKGFKVRQGKMASEVKKATVSKGQMAKRTLDDDLPDLEDKDVQDAATKIQAAFKGHRIRQGKMASEVKKATVFKGQQTKKILDDDLPDLEDKDIQDAVTKIQAAFKGFKVRQGKMASEVKKATVFKGQRAKQMPDDDLPDLEDKDVQDAATKIQAAFKGHKVRQGKMSSEVKKAMVFKGQRTKQTVDDDLPDLEDKDVQDAVTKIQAAFKGFKVRQSKMSAEVKKATVFKARSTKQTPDDDLPDLEDKDVQDAATKIQAAFKGHKVRQGKMSSEVKKAMVFKDQRAKQTVDNDLPDLEDKDVQDAVTKIQAAFKGFKVRQGKMASEVKKTTVFKGKRTKQVLNDDLPDLEDKDVQDAATKIQAAFKGHKVRLAKKLKPDDDLPDLNDRGIQDAATKIQAAFKGHKVRKAKQQEEDLPDLKDKDVQNAATKIQAAFKGHKVRKAHNVQDSDGAKKQPVRIGSKEEDLIQVVLTAVEDNWLKQAPHPTLDKSKALQVERDESADLSESERDTSEADYLKVKEKAAQLVSDDEGTHLCRQESNGDGDRDFSYLETTLPQERPGIGMWKFFYFTNF